MRGPRETLGLMQAQLTRRSPVVANYLRGRRVLDIGCGNGRLLREAPESFVGVDTNPLLVAEAVSRGFRAVVGDARALPFRDDAFDAINCDNVIEHLFPDAAQSMLGEAARVVRPGGTILLRTLMATQQVWNTFSHVRPYPPEAIRKLLASPLERGRYHRWLSCLTIEGILYLGPYSRLRLLTILGQAASQFLPWLRRGYVMIFRKRTAGSPEYTAATSGA